MADNNKNDKNKLFNFFSSTDNKGVDKKKEKFNGKYNLENYFKFLKRNFSNITKLNLMFILLCFPVFIFLLGFAGFFNNNVPAPQNLMYPQVYGVMQYDKTSAAIISLNNVFGISTTIAEITTITKTLMYSGFLFLITYGFANTGMSHILRSMIRRQPIFIWSDFFECIKKNWKQSLIIGFLDGGISFLLIYDIIQYSANRSSYMLQIFYFIILFITVMFFIIRFYMYLILITFDLPIKKNIGNSMRFVLLGIKRNLCAVLAMIIIGYISLNLYFLLPMAGILMPMIFTIAFGAFTTAYCAYPVISKYMIEPYYKIETNKDGDPVFIDRG